MLIWNTDNDKLTIVVVEPTIIGEPAMKTVKMFFLALYEAINDMKMYKAQKHIEKYMKK